MTSTPINVGLNSDKMSSRVLRPPGGGHTDIFGGDPEPPRGKRRGPNAVQHQSHEVNVAEPAPEPVAQPYHANVEEPQQEATPPPPVEEAPRQPRNIEDTKHQNVQQQVPLVPKRGRVPPGGFSSGLW